MKTSTQALATFWVFGCLLSASVPSEASCPKLRKPDKPFNSRSVGAFYTLTPNPIGATAPDKIQRSRQFGIAYHSRGLEYVNACQSSLRAESLEAYLQFKKTSENASDESLAEFKAHSEVLIYQPRAISDIVDRCFSKIRQQWLQCGGKYAKTARHMTRIRKELRVQIMPNAFMAFNTTGGQKIWVAGLASTDGRSIFASTSTLSRNSSGVHYVRSLESLVCWELGNNFAMNHGTYARTLSQELGFQVPCEFYKK